MEEIINKLQTENELQKQKQVIKFELTVLVNVWAALTLCLGKIDFGDIGLFYKKMLYKKAPRNTDYLNYIFLSYVQLLTSIFNWILCRLI